MAAVATALGWHSQVLLVEPGTAAIATTRAALDQLPTCMPSTDHGVVLLRSHWSIPANHRAIRAAHARGWRVIIEVPTPASSGWWEIWGAERPLPARVVRAATEMLWTPWGWFTGDVLASYAPDHHPLAHMSQRMSKPQQVRISNGVDVASRTLADTWASRDTCRLLGMGTMSHWHGYDRVIQALPQHPQISLMLAGNGPALPRLRTLTQDLGVDTQVSFLGQCDRNQLNQALQAADIGVASLGEHRRHAHSLSLLKTHEFLAHGLPVVLGDSDPAIPRVLPWIYQAEPGETPLALADLRNWLAQLRKTTTAHDIRSYAQTELDVSIAMRQLLG